MKHKPRLEGTEPPFSGIRYNRPEQEARRLGISRRCLTNWINSRMIPVIRRGRTLLFNPLAVDQALKRFEQEEVTRNG